MMNQPDHAAEKNIIETDPGGRRRTICMLNDQFRSGLAPGSLIITLGVSQLRQTVIGAILASVRAFDAFDASNDPHQEHDFGRISHADKSIFWKIDYFDKMLEYGSADPADPAVTIRVLTVMLADEY